MSVIIPIDLGTVPNDGTGDPLRVGGQSINTNFANLNADKLESGGYPGTGQDLFTLLNGKVSKTGDTMTGDLIMQGVNIKSPTATLTLGGQNILYADITVNDAEYLLAVGKTLSVTGSVKNTALFGLSNTLGNTQIVQNCIIGGELNTINGTVDDSIISGEGNTHNALASFTIGEGNTNQGNFNIVSGLNNLCNGDENVVSGQSILASGNGNIIGGISNINFLANNNLIGGGQNDVATLANDNLIVGRSNQLFTPASRNMIGGQNNQVVLSNNIVAGLNNFANVNRGLLVGINNNLQGQNDLVGGANNTVGGSGNNIVGGNNNSVITRNGLVVGEDNQTTGTQFNNNLLGVGCVSNRSNTTILGRYNLVTNDALFTVGYGTTDLNRANAFEVTVSGNLRTPNLLSLEANNDSEASALGVGIGEQYMSYGKRVVVRKGLGTVNKNVAGNMLSYSGSFVDFGSSAGTTFPTNGDACQFGVAPVALQDHVGNLAISYDAFISKVSCKWSSSDDFVTDVGTAVVSFKFYECQINDDVSLPASWTLIHTLTTTWDNTSGSSPGFIEDVLPSNIAVDANTLIAFVAETTVNFAQNEEVEVTLILENR